MMMNICGKNGRPFTRIWSCTLIKFMTDLIRPIKVPGKKWTTLYFLHPKKTETSMKWNSHIFYY
jgi:hypothetical protein